MFDSPFIDGAIPMFRIAAVAAGIFVLMHSAPQSAAHAQGLPPLEDDGGTATAPMAASEDRLLIVNGNNGRVIYDDGLDDLFCVTRLVFAGYDDHGRPIRKRTMRCR